MVPGRQKGGRQDSGKDFVFVISLWHFTVNGCKKIHTVLWESGID